ncbi:Uncharacterised protein r2_g1338 [Pycnogonum litorale]
MKISVIKIETLLLSRRPRQYALHVNGVSLKQVEKFEYLGVVVFTSDGRRDIELDTRIAAAGPVMRQLQRSVLLRRELGVKTEFAVFKLSLFTMALGSPWGNDRIQVAEMKFLKRIAGLTMLDRVRSSEIRETPGRAALLLQITAPI